MQEANPQNLVLVSQFSQTLLGICNNYWDERFKTTGAGKSREKERTQDAEDNMTTERNIKIDAQRLKNESKIGKKGNQNCTWQIPVYHFWAGQQRKDPSTSVQRQHCYYFITSYIQIMWTIWGHNLISLAKWHMSHESVLCLPWGCRWTWWGCGVTFGALSLDLWYDMRALAGGVLLLWCRVCSSSTAEIPQPCTSSASVLQGLLNIDSYGGGRTKGQYNSCVQ